MKGTLLRFASSIALASGLLAQVSTQAPAVTGAAEASTSPEQAAQSLAKFNVTTRLVLLNVLVHHRGHPVGGLSKTDFEVTDAGRPQTISLFSVNQFLHGSQGTPPARTLPPNVVTNRPTSRLGVPASVTVLLIDTYNTGSYTRSLLSAVRCTFFITWLGTHIVSPSRIIASWPLPMVRLPSAGRIMHMAANRS